MCVCILVYLCFFSGFQSGTCFFYYFLRFLSFFCKVRPSLLFFSGFSGFSGFFPGTTFALIFFRFPFGGSSPVFLKNTICGKNNREFISKRLVVAHPRKPLETGTIKKNENSPILRHFVFLAVQPQQPQCQCFAYIWK